MEILIILWLPLIAYMIIHHLKSKKESESNRLKSLDQMNDERIVIK